MDDTIWIIKLINGEMLIGLVEESEKQITIKDSLQIALIQENISLFNINSQLSDNYILVVDKDKILYKFRPKNTIKNWYIENLSEESNENDQLQ